MNASLYEITREYLEALDHLEIDEETGEILNAEELDKLAGAFDEKVESVACYIKNLTAFAGDLKEEEANLAKRRKSAEKKVDYWRLSEELEKRSEGAKEREEVYCPVL